MSRIRVIPENLRFTGASLRVKSENLYALATQIRNSVNGMDWETRRKVNIEGQINAACSQARGLATQMQELSRYLQKKAQAFEEADRQGAEGLHTLDGSIMQLTGGTPFSHGTIFEWMKKLWPFAPIAILPIGFLRLLPNIPWPTKVKPMPIKSVTPAPIIPGVYKPKPPFDKIYIFPGGTYPTYGNNMGAWAGKKHDGVDIRPDPWDENLSYPVSPIGPGKVIQVSTQYMKDKNGQIILDENGNKKIDGYGNYVIIEHTLQNGTKIYSRYAHLAELPKLSVGQEVGTNTENSNIGIMGSTGRSTAPHVHLEIWTMDSNNQKALEDPLPVIIGDSNYQFNISPGN